MHTGTIETCPAAFQQFRNDAVTGGMTEADFFEFTELLLRFFSA
jgi:hypothetical protein